MTLTSTLGHISREKHDPKDICTPVFIAALFTIAKIWKKPECLLTEEWIKKMCYTHSVKYYPAIKKNEIMPSVATWVDLEIVILSEISQTEKVSLNVESLK